MTYVYNGEEVILTGRIASNTTTASVVYVEVKPVDLAIGTTKWVKYEELNVVRLIEENDIEA